MNGFIKLNGNTYPAPINDLNLVVSTMVDSARNTNGVMVGQRVGRDLYKLDNLSWLKLDAATWSSILHEFDGFVAELQFPDMVENSWRAIKIYPSDRTANVLAVDENGFPIMYCNCKVNLIDVGE